MNDTYSSFDGKTAEEVMALIKEFGNGEEMESTQNDSPTIQEMLDLAKKYPTITYIGYVIKKPRSDFRVSLEGFYITGLTWEQANDLRKEFGHADEFDMDNTNRANEGVFVRAWWD